MRVDYLPSCALNELDSRNAVRIARYEHGPDHMCCRARWIRSTTSAVSIIPVSGDKRPGTRVSGRPSPHEGAPRWK